MIRLDSRVSKDDFCNDSFLVSNTIAGMFQFSNGSRRIFLFLCTGMYTSSHDATAVELKAGFGCDTLFSIEQKTNPLNRPLHYSSYKMILTQRHRFLWILKEGRGCCSNQQIWGSGHRVIANGSSPQTDDETSVRSAYHPRR